MGHAETPAYTALFRKEMGRNVHNNWNGYSFFDKNGRGDILEFLDIYMEHYLEIREKGYISVPTGNHDLPRISIGRTDEELELIFAFILTMPGVPFIYYGDEIGMGYLDHIISKEGGYNRTGSRTPMQWSSGRNAGFSIAPEELLYLPVDRTIDCPTVEVRERVYKSLLNNVRRMMSLRKSSHALCANEEFMPLYARSNQYPFIYLRTFEDEKFMVLINPSKEASEAVFESNGFEMYSWELKMGHNASLSKEHGQFHVTISGISYSIFQLQDYHMEN